MSGQKRRADPKMSPSVSSLQRRYLSRGKRIQIDRRVADVLLLAASKVEPLNAVERLEMHNLARRMRDLVDEWYLRKAVSAEAWGTNPQTQKPRKSRAILTIAPGRSFPAAALRMIEAGAA